MTDFVCTVCGKLQPKTTTPIGFATHERMCKRAAMKARIFLCRDCGAEFPHQANYAKHCDMGCDRPAEV